MTPETFAPGGAITGQPVNFGPCPDRARGLATLIAHPAENPSAGIR